MNCLSLLAASSLLLLSAADNPQGLPWRSNSAPQPGVLAGVKMPLYPFMNSPDQSQTPGQTQPGNQTVGQAQNQSPDAAGTKSDGRLKPASELSLVRFVDGEFAHAVRSIPGGKEGLILYPNKNFDDQALQRALRIHGAAANPGDPVQVTALKFQKTKIEVSINGGGKKKWNWRQHIDIGIIGLPSATTTANDGSNGPDGTYVGCTVILDFGRPVPDMTPDDLKAYLANVLDFSKERSAAVQWVQTLPPDVQKAITEKKPIVGMTREMVEAAIGKPDRKVRERNADGDETEDWIYGQPPAITMFVTFIGEKVVRIKQFPKDTIAKN